MGTKRRGTWQAVEVEFGTPPKKLTILTTHPTATLGRVVDLWNQSTATHNENSLCRYITKRTKYHAITMKQYETKINSTKK